MYTWPRSVYAQQNDLVQLRGEFMGFVFGRASMDSSFCDKMILENVKKI